MGYYYVSNDLKEIAIGILLITNVGLVFMLAFIILLLETGNEEPARTFPVKLYPRYL